MVAPVRVKEEQEKLCVQSDRSQAARDPPVMSFCRQSLNPTDILLIEILFLLYFNQCFVPALEQLRSPLGRRKDQTFFLNIFISI